MDALNLKILWAVAISLFLSIGFYQTYELLEEYLSYPYVTLIKEHNISPLDAYSFPDIHVCNINPSGLLRQAPNNGGMEEFLKLVENKTTCDNCSQDDHAILNQIEMIFNLLWDTLLISVRTEPGICYLATGTFWLNVLRFRLEVLPVSTATR